MSRATQLQLRRIANIRRLRETHADATLVAADAAARHHAVAGDRFLRPAPTLHGDNAAQLADRITGRLLGAGQLFAPFATAAATTERSAWGQQCLAVTKTKLRTPIAPAQFRRDVRAFLRFARAFVATQDRLPTRSEVYYWMTYHPETPTTVEPTHLAIYRHHAAALYRRCGTRDTDTIEIIPQDDPTDHESWLYLRPRDPQCQPRFDYRGVRTSTRFYLAIHPAFAAQIASTLIDTIKRADWDVDLKLPSPFVADEELQHHLHRPDKIVMYCPRTLTWEMRRVLGRLWNAMHPAFVNDPRPVRFAATLRVYDPPARTHHTPGIYEADEVLLYNDDGCPLTSFHGLYAMLLAYLLARDDHAVPRTATAIRTFQQQLEAALYHCGMFGAYQRLSIEHTALAALQSAVDETMREHPEAEWEDIFPTMLFPE
ncbi:MAG: hypothetical protein HY696_11025 [Deltaproteobacteria bacterium]|nr:hypothetical protein [Deltaproteobacteria bacterium]